ncbi:MAG: sigma-70 family RNA polymerase sigma factor [Planctomycetes bacterium]|nr:sigma-70 family RNA polymerase sigma factor [Planctomycetota bacterium]
MTSWTLIHAAAQGDQARRGDFVRLYGPIIESFLRSRWSSSRQRAWIPDAIQEVYVECLRERGVLHTTLDAKPRSFRAFLHGVVRNVAGRHERSQYKRRERLLGTTEAEVTPPRIDRDPAREFDRHWARGIIRESLARLGRSGPSEERGLELLRLRFEEGKPIRDIARAWNVDAESLHREYARTRRSFTRILTAIVAEHEPSHATDVRAECRRLLHLMS